MNHIAPKVGFGEAMSKRTVTIEEFELAITRINELDRLVNLLVSDRRDEEPPILRTPDGAGVARRNFSSVVWHGRMHVFDGHLQRSIVRVLWLEYLRAPGLPIELCELKTRIGHSHGDMKIGRIFRGHPALGSIIRLDGRGRYRFSILSENCPSLDPHLPPKRVVSNRA